MEVLPKPLVMKLAKMKVNGYMRKYAKINVKGLENIFSRFDEIIQGIERLVQHILDYLHACFFICQLYILTFSLLQ